VQIYDGNMLLITKGADILYDGNMLLITKGTDIWWEHVIDNKKKIFTLNLRLCLFFQLTKYEINLQKHLRQGQFRKGSAFRNTVNFKNIWLKRITHYGMLFSHLIIKDEHFGALFSHLTLKDYTLRNAVLHLTIKDDTLRDTLLPIDHKGWRILGHCSPIWL